MSHMLFNGIRNIYNFVTTNWRAPKERQRRKEYGNFMRFESIAKENERTNEKKKKETEQTEWIPYDANMMMKTINRLMLYWYNIKICNYFIVSCIETVKRSHPTRHFHFQVIINIFLNRKICCIIHCDKPFEPTHLVNEYLSFHRSR